MAKLWYGVVWYGNGPIPTGDWYEPQPKSQTALDQAKRSYLSTSGWAVEQHVWQTSRDDGILECSDDFGLVGDLLQVLWSVTFHPRFVTLARQGYGRSGIVVFHDWINVALVWYGMVPNNMVLSKERDLRLPTMVPP